VFYLWSGSFLLISRTFNTVPPEPQIAVINPKRSC
jgi:hypothetical protein